MDFHKNDFIPFFEKVTNLPCEPLLLYIVPYIDRDFLKNIKTLKTIDYLITPIDFNQLLEKLSEHFSSKENSE